MSSNSLKMKLQLRRDDLSAWTEKNTVLADGELALAKRPDGTVEMRVGNGLSGWNDLTAVPFVWGADQIEGLEDALSSLKTSHYEVNSLEELSGSYLNGDTAVVKTVMGVKVVDGLSSNVYSHTAYIYDGDLSVWKAMDGNYSADNVIFDTDLTYTKGIGVLADPGTKGKDTLAAKGKSLEEVLKSILASKVSATPVKPTATYGTPSNFSSNVEVGTWASGGNALTFKWTADGKWSNYNTGVTAGNKILKSSVFAKRTASQTAGAAVISAGNYDIADFAVSATLTGDGNVVLNENNPILSAIAASDLSVQYRDADYNLYSYVISAAYQQGTTVPKDNLGDDDPDNKIAAGTFSTSGTIKISAGKRRRFWYVGTDLATPIDNTFFRNIASGTVTGGGSELDSSTSMTKNLTIPDKTKRIVFAVEGANKNLNKVIDVDGMGLDVKGNFDAKKINSLDIEGANGFEAKAYTVFVLEEPAGLKPTTYQFS